MQSGFELAGDRMTFEERDDGSVTVRWDDKGTGRSCGSCQLCCKLVPVPQISKPAGVRCEHARVGKGCAIYSARPTSCRTWSCRWLSDPTASGLRRPDRGHYVVDIEYDTVARIEAATGATVGSSSVLQVWVDPGFREAHKAPELRAYIADIGERYGIPTIIRWSSRDAMVLYPPAVTGGEWVEDRVAEVVARDDLEAHVLEVDRRALEQRRSRQVTRRAQRA